MPVLTQATTNIPAGYRVKIIQSSQTTHTIQAWTPNGVVTDTVPLDYLEPDPQVNQEAITRYTQTPLITQAPSKYVPTTRKQEQIKFDASLFSEAGKAISCNCGKVIRHIAPAYIRAWANENAAINYVTSLCGYCHKPVEFTNATRGQQ